jgi:3-(3-hydroxy-phenyl)propionate hydroxylase
VNLCPNNAQGPSWGWSLLAFDGRRADSLPELRQAFTEVEHWTWVRPRLVLGAAVAGKDDAKALYDLDGEVHAAYGVGDKAALILVRPDGHIAFRGRADRPDMLRAYCLKVAVDDGA